LFCGMLGENQFCSQSVGTFLDPKWINRFFDFTSDVPTDPLLVAFFSLALAKTTCVALPAAFLIHYGSLTAFGAQVSYLEEGGLVWGERRAEFDGLMAAMPIVVPLARLLLLLALGPVFQVIIEHLGYAIR